MPAPSRCFCQFRVPSCHQECPCFAAQTKGTKSKIISYVQIKSWLMAPIISLSRVAPTQAVLRNSVRREPRFQLAFNIEVSP